MMRKLEERERRLEANKMALAPEEGEEDGKEANRMTLERDEDERMDAISKAEQEEQ